MPEAAGEYTWTTGTGDSVSLTFFNEVDGLTLKSGVDYTASLAINANDACRDLSNISISVSVEGN
jgi:hypothetical protein